MIKTIKRITDSLHPMLSFTRNLQVAPGEWKSIPGACSETLEIIKSWLGPEAIFAVRGEG
jgi:hypothetical protein